MCRYGDPESCGRHSEEAQCDIAQRRDHDACRHETFASLSLATRAAVAITSLYGARVGRVSGMAQRHFSRRQLGIARVRHNQAIPRSWE
jgi:hypothetical protein